MIDPKFKDMLTIANMDYLTPDMIADFRNHRKRIQQGEDALKMRNSVLFGNTFANPEPTTNATFIPPQEGSMYDPQNQRRKLATELDIAMTTDPRNTINPTMTPDIFARPGVTKSYSALMSGVNPNNASANILMGTNINKNAVADNLEKTIGAVDKRENKLAKRREAFDKVRRFGLALQGKDPNAMDAKKLMQMLDMQYKTNLMNSQMLKDQDRASIIAFARSQAPNDPTLSDSRLNAIMNNDAVALQYGNREAKGNEPEDVLNNYVLTSTISPNAFNFLQQNLNKFSDDAEGKMIKDILSKTTYDEYVKNEKSKTDFNSLLRRQTTTGDDNLNRYINGSFVTESERDALNFASQRSFFERLR
tara:strand:- start:5531 stop:6619 length:1089 start_codon:yes stop_codon:yes gene_type:complete